MNNNKLFYILVAGFTGGIFLSSIVNVGFSFFILLLILATVILIFGYCLSKQKKIIVLLSLFIFALAFGVLRYELKEIRTDNPNLVGLVGQTVTVSGTIILEPNVKDSNVQLIVASERVTSDSQTFSTNGKILITGDLFPEFHYGDLIKAEGKLIQPKNFSQADSNDFDYINYLAKDDIFYEMKFAKLTVLAVNRGSFLKQNLLALKSAFSRKINSLIREPESALLNGLILGAKNSLGQELQAEFRQAGVSHIVALSGYNITIVAVGIMALLSFLPRALSLSFGAVSILLFAVMTGGSATVMRASIMALLVLLAKASGRKYDISRALILAGIFMLLLNPKILVFDVSFQLSFLSTVALIWVAPIVEKRLTFLTKKYKFRELVVATLATQLFVLPFILYKLGLVSVFSLLTNLLILPAIPLIMFLGFLTGVIGFILNPLAGPLAFVCSGLLTYVLTIIKTFSHLPLATITATNFPVFLVMIIYLIYLCFILKENRIGQKIYENI